MLNICVNICLVFAVMGTIAACAPQPGEITRIALLAPFEGRYRDVGYDAYYAAKLAIQEWGDLNIEVLAVDDGGTVESAVERAKGLTLDPLVIGVIALGYPATDAETQAAYGDLPVLVIGNWDAEPERDSIFIVSNPAIDEILTAPNRVDVTETSIIDTPFVGGEIFGLAQVAELGADVSGITIVTSGTVPDETFRERYLASAQFAPEPGLLAALAYQAAGWILRGERPFEDGYWKDAPINYYAYDEAGSLVAVDRPVEQR